MSTRPTPFAQRGILGGSPVQYKLFIGFCLVLNPILHITVGGFYAGWALLLEFIVTLALATKGYPLQGGGLIFLEGLFALKLTSVEAVEHHVAQNLDVLLLLVCMVPAIYFERELLVAAFRRILLGVRVKVLLSLSLCVAGAVLSAFLDAMTVITVIITVTGAFFFTFRAVAAGFAADTPYDPGESFDDETVLEPFKAPLGQFLLFLCSLLMSGAVGTALGGVLTIVGEPQNLVVADRLGWHFSEFFFAMAPVTVPCLLLGLITCALVEHFGIFGYGTKMPAEVRTFLEAQAAKEARDPAERKVLLWQALTVALLVAGLGFHIGPPWFVGLTVLILVTTLTGVNREEELGPAFHASLPFCMLLLVFFGVIAIIDDQHLLNPVVDLVMGLPQPLQPVGFFAASATVTCVSDNVLTATMFIDEAKKLFDSGSISREHFEALGVAINVGTNLPSVATPNGQAAFLFLLTSPLALALGLSYGKMVKMALPYTIVLTLAGAVLVFRYGG